MIPRLFYKRRVSCAGFRIAVYNDTKQGATLERQLRVNGKLVQSLDHFFAMTLDREDIESRESHLSQHWLPISSLRDYDLCPRIVRDVIAEGRLHSVRHLVVPLGDG